MLSDDISREQNETAYMLPAWAASWSRTSASSRVSDLQNCESWTSRWAATWPTKVSRPSLNLIPDSKFLRRGQFERFHFKYQIILQHKTSLKGPLVAYFPSYGTKIFTGKICRLQWDSNSDCRSRRRACWPLDHHHSPNAVIFTLASLSCSSRQWYRDRILTYIIGRTSVSVGHVRCLQCDQIGRFIGLWAIL